jgi:hypothetical protein
MRFDERRDVMISLLDELMRQGIVGAYEFEHNRELFVRGNPEPDDDNFVTRGINIVFDAHGEIM